MTGKDIMEALSFADDKYIQEAQEESIGKKSPVHFLLPLAACLCLVLFGLHMRPVPPASPAEGAMQEPGMAMGAEVHTQYSENDVPLEPVMGAYEDQIPASGEVPSVVLEILEWTEDGFVAAVDSLVDTGLIPVGTVLQVEMLPNLVVETIRGDLVYAERRMATETEFPAGSLVRVMFCSYSEEDQVLKIESICKEG